MKSCSKKAALRSGFVLLILIFVLFSYPVQVLAADGDWLASELPPDESRVGSACLLNLENDLILYEKNADKIIYPTSAVKIMTGLIASRELADRLDEVVTISAPMLAGAEGRNMGLVTGEQMKVFDLLIAAVCGSYNDAACVVAALSAGSVESFISMMNREAERLGALSTVYKNPTGLHDAAMVTTARDTLLIAREAVSNELYMSMAQMHFHTIPATNASDARTIQNRNALVSDTGGQYYNGWCRGLNAGMTDEGGWCVITLWEKNGASNLSVVMNAADVEVGASIPAYTYTNRLLSWAGRCYGYRTILNAGKALDTLPVAMTGTSKSETEIYIPTDLQVYLPTHVDPSTQVTVTCHLTDGALVAPLSSGSVVGQLTVTYGGRVVGTSEIVVLEDFERNGFLNLMEHFKAYLGSRACIISLVIFVVTLLVYLKYTIGPGKRYTAKNVYVKKHRKREFRAKRTFKRYRRL